MPIYASPSYHGYDVTDYRAVHPDYGTLEDFDAFMAEADRRNIRVILDFVLNHSSSEHPWFRAARADPASPYRSWYSWRQAPPPWKRPWDGGPVWHQAQGCPAPSPRCARWPRAASKPACVATLAAPSVRDGCLS
jgi:glycosidase